MPHRAIMLCDFNNPVSVQYSEISKRSFEGTKKLNVELWQCFTPDTRKDNPYMLNWAEQYTGEKKGGAKRVITETEKACFESHLYWWIHIANTGEQIVIMEHDAYCRDVDKFESMIDNVNDYALWNCGIAMECYTIDILYAQFLKKVFSHKFVASSGPMAVLYELYKTYYYVKEKNSGRDVKPILWPSNKNPFSVVTQCYDTKLGNTIKHDNFFNPIDNPDLEIISYV